MKKKIFENRWQAVNGSALELTRGQLLILLAGAFLTGCAFFAMTGWAR
jgi:hypothetical protein